MVGPAVKKAITNSSSESVKTSSAPATTAGRIAGSVTRRNVVTAPAPRSRDASSSDRSMPASRARTTATTKAVPNAAWASRMVTADFGMPAA